MVISHSNLLVFDKTGEDWGEAIDLVPSQRIDQQIYDMVATVHKVIMVEVEMSHSDAADKIKFMAQHIKVCDPKDA